MLKQKSVTIGIAPPKMTAFRSPLLWLVLLIGFFTTFLVWRLSNRDIAEQTKERFDSRAEQIVTAVEQRMRAYEQVLRGGVGLFRTQPTITRHQWYEYVENIDLAKNYPGIQNFAVDFPIPAAEKDAHIAQVRAEGHPEYSIVPEQPERPVYHSLVYVEPFGGRNLRAFGFDMYTNPIRREAMDRAIDLGLPSVSGMVKLAQETNEDVQHGFIYCLPVYHTGRLIATPDQRRAALRALVCGGFRANDLMRGIFGARTSDLEIEVYDGAITQETQMYNSRRGDKIAVSTFSRTVATDVGGRTWNLRVSANQTFINSISWTQSQLVMLSGTLLSFALFLSLGLWFDIERRTQERVRRNSQIFNAVQDSVKESLLVINKSGIVISSNPTAAQRFDLSPDQLIGRSIFEILPPDIVAKWRALDEEVIRSGRPITSEHALKGRDYLNNLYPVFDSRNQCEAIVILETDITERKHIEEALHESEKRYRLLFEANPHPMWVFDLETLAFLQVNDAAVAHYGYSRDEFLAMTIADIRPADDVATLTADIGHIDVGAMDEGSVWRHRKKDGSIIDVEITAHTIDDGGRLARLVLVQDITERKRAELERQHRASELEESQRIARIGSWEWTIATGDVTWSEGMNHVLARDCGSPSPTFETLPQFYTPESWQRLGVVIASAIETGAPYDLDLEMIRPDGAACWTTTRGEAIRGADGTVVKLRGTVLDITERRQAEREFRESERRFSDMLGNVELVSLMLDREARITYCNDYFLRLTGWQREKVIGRNWVELFVPAGNNYVKDHYAALLANRPEALHREYEILTHSGEHRLIRWNNSVLRSGAGDVIGTASIGEDITEQKRAEIRIKRLNRVYAVLSSINTLIVRVRDRDELFREACRIAVEAGAFKMAWIGVIDPQTRDGKVVTWHGGEEGYVDKIRLTARDGTPDSERPACRALRLLQPVICNDFAADPSMAPLLDEMLRRGHKSVGCFPLTIEGRTDVVIALFSGEADFFDEEEMKLLNELAGNIAFAIDHIDKQERLNYLAYYDGLTGLANRHLFLERVAQCMRSAVSGGHKLAVALIDLERFKNINDSLGRPAGDALLRQVAEWMTHITGDSSLLARVGADLFAGVLPQVKQGGDVARLLEKTMQAFLDHPFRLNDAVFRVAAKVGVAVFPDDGVDADTLFRNAEAALKKAKASGERYLFYTQDMTEAVAGKLTLENQLRQALDNEEFVLHYQPKVNLVSGKLTGTEALIRWNDPRTGLVPPGRFIPILEETGLIFDVGRWALKKAIEDYLRWRAAGLPAVRIAVNVSPLQLRNRGFADEIARVIGIDAQAPAGLELEITESLIMADVQHNITSLQAIRDIGVSIAIDDFGTGFSSLSYLAKLPIDTIKIDRSFIIDMTAGPAGLALVSTIINLAHSLKLKVVAEGVETEEQSRLLRLLNCDEMQGFLFSKPVPAEIFETRFLAPPPAG